MASFLPNGIGYGSTGDSLATTPPLQTSGNVWYVSSLLGTDAVSPRGLNSQTPLATLGQAITNAADGDIIALANHGELLSSALTISKAVTIVGCTSAAGVPSVTFGRTGGASANLFTITAAGVQLRGLRLLETATSAVATARIAVSVARFRMIGCLVEMGEFDTGPAVSLDSGANSAEFRNCTFNSTAVSGTSANAPESAIKSSAALTEVRMYGCTFSGGDLGFTNFYAVDLSSAAVTRFEGERLSLLLGADMKLHASSTGWANVELATGGARVDW